MNKHHPRRTQESWVRLDTTRAICQTKQSHKREYSTKNAQEQRPKTIPLPDILRIPKL
ncbi:protein of unknown function [Azospirillum lipoferum 4B]|uniref:Uncharacterized protein n=1 Tax=Azospirillum lipoferum (strain 4B) TaxID=862719 RepID=G7Z2Q2_AZOL4|nr:protein of unknown function [Azospirillum lipoferum 4B]